MRGSAEVIAVAWDVVVQPIEARAGIRHDEVRGTPNPCLPLPQQRFVLRSWFSRGALY